MHFISILRCYLNRFTVLMTQMVNNCKRLIWFMHLKMTQKVCDLSKNSCVQIWAHSAWIRGKNQCTRNMTHKRFQLFFCKYRLFCFVSRIFSLLFWLTVFLFVVCETLSSMFDSWCRYASSVNVKSINFITHNKILKNSIQLTQKIIHFIYQWKMLNWCVMCRDIFRLYVCVRVANLKL